MREKGQTEAAKTLETPVFSRGIEILTEKNQFLTNSGDLWLTEFASSKKWHLPLFRHADARGAVVLLLLPFSAYDGLKIYCKTVCILTLF